MGDAPVLIRFTAFLEDARVVITQPANPQWREIVVNVPAGLSRNVDLTEQIGFVRELSRLSSLNQGD